MIFARRLQSAFNRFGAGIGEEDAVGEGQTLAHLARQLFTRRDAEHV